ncbi:DUF397 domain-containing protein [Streptomyces sp. CA-252508]|uniref:DUF397 domain-containing protein n=1 Tax=Streptomyces sp. CA-252508 TaxID=3418946 RepID=UPI003D8D0D0F
MTIDPEHPASPGLIWCKSTYSGSGGGDCVEVAITPGTVHVRDSKDSMGQQLTFTGPAWQDFLATATES